MALRITPSALHASSTASTSGAPSAPGVHDTLRSNLSLTASNLPSAPQSFHPLESRLSQWRAQQTTLKMELLRRQFGIAEPVRRGMEMLIVTQAEWRPACMGAGGNVHADVLAGREAEIDWEDVYQGQEMRDEVPFHGEMEGRFGMGW